MPGAPGALAATTGGMVRAVGVTEPCLIGVARVTNA
jgi:hypothetical protein